MSKKIKITILLIISFSYLNLHADSKKDSDQKKDSALLFFDKGAINDPIMTIDEGTFRVILDRHIYQIREGSIGGYNTVGGSCGCN